MASVMPDCICEVSIGFAGAEISAGLPANLPAPSVPQPSSWLGAGALSALGRAWEYVIDEAAAAEAASVPLASRRMALNVDITLSLTGGPICPDN